MQNRYVINFMILVTLCFMCLFESCSNSTKINEHISLLKRKPIDIPYRMMNKKLCYLYADTICSNDIEYQIVNYYKSHGCDDCIISKIAIVDRFSYLKSIEHNVNNIFILDIPSNEENEIYRELCVERIRSTVYLDTCNAFLSANPQIPDNKLYHTFVINKEGKVLMVGNPFQNEKMEELSKKVIAKERKKQKKNANKAA